MNSEIPSSNWAEFFLKLNEVNRNSLITVEHKTLDGQTKHNVATERPLKEIVLGKDSCNDRIMIRIGGAPGQRDLDHEIVEPIRVMVKEEAGERKAIQVEAENGVTIVTLRNGRIPVDYQETLAQRGSSDNRLTGVQGR